MSPDDRVMPSGSLLGPRARFGRNRYRFVTVPSELDSNSNNLAIVNAALLSGLYPKLLCVEVTDGLQMRTLSNNQLAFFHPSSVNFRSKPKDVAANYLAYFTLMYVVARHNMSNTLTTV